MELTFTVEKINFRKDLYAIIRGKIISHNFKNERISKKITIKGNFVNLFEGDEFTCKGSYELDEYYGYYIQLLEMPVKKIPDNEKSLANFISKRVKGLSKGKALELVRLLGLDLLSKIENCKPIMIENGFTEKKADSIIKQLLYDKPFEDLSIFIQSIGLSSSVTNVIYNKYEENSLNTIKENPYFLCYDGDISFKDIDIIGKNVGYKFDRPSRIKGAIVSFFRYFCERTGDLYIEEYDFFENFKDFLIRYSSFIEDENFLYDSDIKKNLKFLIENNTIKQENDNDKTYYYLAMFYFLEARIIKNISNIALSYTQPFACRDSILEAIENYEFNNFLLDEKQKEAIENSLLNRISILTGGPGTGKTQTTSAIVDCIFQINPEATIKLLAPTGKASDRMTELIKLQASTIHKGLKLNPFRNVDDLEQIEEDFVIVDESSMIDFFLFDKLISLIGENTRVIFVGDIEQLPPIGMGYIFKDLINCDFIPSVRLEKIFRQGLKSLITTNAHKIIKGVTTKVENGVDISNDKNKDFFFIKALNEDFIIKKIIASINRLIDHYNYSLNDIIILSPLKEGYLGVKELNRYIQESFNKQDKELIIDDFKKFKLYDRVINIKNDYSLKVFNGYVGRIVDIRTKINRKGLVVNVIDVEYPQRTVSYEESQFEMLELAYAITTHKSQGSEFKAVIIPIHKSQNMMLNRNLIYTAITRAKERCILIGDEYYFNKSILTHSNNIKKSRVSNKLSFASEDDICF